MKGSRWHMLATHLSCDGRRWFTNYARWRMPIFFQIYKPFSGMCRMIRTISFCRFSCCPTHLSAQPGATCRCWRAVAWPVHARPVHWLRDLAMVRPPVLVSVPRIYECLYALPQRLTHAHAQTEASGDRASFRETHFQATCRASVPGVTSGRGSSAGE